MSLTDTAIKKAKPRERAYKLTDENDAPAATTMIEEAWRSHAQRLRKIAEQMTLS